MKILKKTLIIILALSLITGFIVFVINIYVNYTTKDLIYKNIEDIPRTKVAIILGAKVYNSGKMSDMLKDRVDTAIELYNSEKIERILVSGDHGRDNYDEVNTIKDYLLEAEIPSEDIFLDHAGFDTYDSMYRAKEIFQVFHAIVVTQEFHLARSVYIGQNLNIQTYGLIADKQPYLGMFYNKARESIAKVKAFFNVHFESKPKYLGDPIPITGDSSLSWD